MMLFMFAGFLFLWAVAIIIFRLIPLETKWISRIAIGLLAITLVVAIAFYITPRTAEPYCNSLAHHHWPQGSFLIYGVIFFLSTLLLSLYARWFGALYAILVLFPLALGAWVVKELCAGMALNFLSDLIQSLILLVTFPLTAIVFGGIFLFYLVYASWYNKNLILPSMALFSLFLLFFQHSMLDWFRFIIDF